jgi:hypothetical protein
MPIYQLGLTFFGLTPKYRTILFKQIHEIVFYGNGGYDWGTVYNMPIWLRNFTFNQINDSFVEKNKNQKAEKSWVSGEAKQEAAKNKKIQVPTYVTKASKK